MDRKKTSSNLSLDQHARFMVSKRPSISDKNMNRIDEVNSALYISDYGGGDI